MLGYFDIILENKNIIVPARIHVVDNNDAGNLLGLETSKELTLLKINLVNVKNMGKNKFINVPNDLKVLCEKYACLTKGKGKFLNYKCKLRVDENVPSKRQRLRCQPCQLHKLIQRKLDQMEREDIIEKVYTPESRVNNMVITTKKSGNIGICLDARQINKAIICKKYPLPRIDTLIDKISGSTVFSKIDLKEVYKQIELDESSRMLTTFITDKGHYRFKSFIYGINTAGD